MKTTKICQNKINKKLCNFGILLQKCRHIITALIKDIHIWDLKLNNIQKISAYRVAGSNQLKMIKH